MTAPERLAELRALAHEGQGHQGNALAHALGYAVSELLDALEWETGRRDAADLGYEWAKGDVRQLTAERDALRAERDRLTAEVEMLRGVGCMEDGDGPCGACRKCARAEAERLRAALSGLVDGIEAGPAYYWPGGPVANALAAARAALATRGETP